MLAFFVVRLHAIWSVILRYWPQNILQATTVSEVEINNTIIKIMGEIYQIFVDLSYLGSADVVFPDPQDEGRGLQDNIVELLAELSLSP